MYFKPIDPNLPTFPVTIAASQTIKKGYPLTHTNGVYSASASGDIPGAIAAEDVTTGSGETAVIRAWILNSDQIWITHTKETAATKANNYGVAADLDLTGGVYSFDYSVTTDACMRCIDKTPGSEWGVTGSTTEIYVRFIESQVGAL